MKILFCILYFPFLAFCSWNQLFSDENDPTIFHNVNVISGNLIVNFQDIQVNSAVQINLSRSYSSSGALDHSNKNYDLLLNELHKGWKVGGGWSLLPHIGLLIDGSLTYKKMSVYVFEKSGALITFKFDKFKDQKKNIVCFKPLDEEYYSYGYLSGNTNPKNYKLEIDFDQNRGVFELPNGTKRIYSLGYPTYDFSDYYNQEDELQDRYIQSYYRIESEKLLSGHLLEYQYDDDFHLKKIIAKNPRNDKIFSALNFEVCFIKDFLQKIDCRSSTKQSISYNFIKHEKRSYLKTVISDHKPIEASTPIPARKGIGLRANSFFIGSKEQLFVNYYTADDFQDERKWYKFPDNIPIHIDKVKNINQKLSDKRVRLASFSYYPDRTDIRDVENLLIRFHHDSKKLIKVEYFDHQDKLHSSQQFFWQDNLLKCKAKLDANNKVIFAKSFEYDERCNVIREVFWGNLTGKLNDDITIDEKGNVLNGEFFEKKYTYFHDTNLLKQEEEENGLTYAFTYLSNTNLLSSKLIFYKNEQIAREFYVYNKDNLLEKIINDDGKSLKIDDLKDISERHLIQYDLDPKTGLKQSINKFYWDIEKGSYVKTTTTKLTYSSKNQIIKEAIYDANDCYRYTIYTDYDEYGNIISKTTPNGQVNTYKYDKFKNLTEIKEVGAEAKKFSYDLANNLTTTENVFSNEKQFTKYDLKNRQIEVKDFKGQITTCKYDDFGNRNLAVFAPKKGTLASSISCQYDVAGNLISSTDANNKITKTTYTAYGKPIKLVYPDSSEIKHIYNKDGSVAKTILQDQSSIIFEYDFLKRIISKKIFSSKEKLLSSEKWVYNYFHLISHTSPTSLVIKYKYDSAGRKIEERYSDVKITFFYDSLGFDTKVQTKDIAICKSYDEGGRIYKKWEEDLLGNTKNQTAFFYNEENKIVKTTRLTSKGLVHDHFEYDHKGRMTKHLDPIGAITRYIYEDQYENELSQIVQCTTIIDPEGNQSIKTENSNGKIISHVKKIRKVKSFLKNDIVTIFPEI